MGRLCGDCIFDAIDASEQSLQLVRYISLLRDRLLVHLVNSPINGGLERLRESLYRVVQLANVQPSLHSLIEHPQELRRPTPIGSQVTERLQGKRDLRRPEIEKQTTNSRLVAMGGDVTRFKAQPRAQHILWCEDEDPNPFRDV